MKSFVIALLLVVVATGAVAQYSIFEIRNGAVAEGTSVDLMGGTVVVTAVRYNGFACSDVAAGPYSAIWVYTSVDPLVAEGDVIEIMGAEYKEYYDLSELDMTTFAGVWQVVGAAPVPIFSMTLTEAEVDFEAWESHILTITDGFSITALLGYGEWDAVSEESGATLRHDDYFFDETVLLLGDCYNDVTGMITFGYGAYKMHPYVDGLTVVDCSVGNDDMSFGALKANYR